jgi:hypothetical protein
MWFSSPRLACVPLVAALYACDFSDPLYTTSNGEGMVLVDSLSGWNEDSRAICLSSEGSRMSCSSRSAEVYIRDARHVGQVQAEWRDGDPSTVDVFVFGGIVERCQARSREGGVEIVLRQLPLSRMPSPDSWNPDTTSRLFRGQPDRCRASV